MRGALAQGDFGRARGVVEGVWGCWVEVCVFGDSHVEEHAVCFAVAKALAFGVGFAEGAAGVESVFCAA